MRKACNLFSVIFYTYIIVAVVLCVLIVDIAKLYIHRLFCKIKADDKYSSKTQKPHKNMMSICGLKKYTNILTVCPNMPKMFDRDI